MTANKKDVPVEAPAAHHWRVSNGSLAVCQQFASELNRCVNLAQLAAINWHCSQVGSPNLGVLRRLVITVPVLKFRIQINYQRRLAGPAFRQFRSIENDSLLENCQTPNHRWAIHAVDWGTDY